MRSVALSRRDYKNCNLIHASAVEYHNKGYMFLGNVSAGKTTILLHLIDRLSAIPISNDRVFLDAKDDVIINSWPSYFSLCEGTILSYDQLKVEDQYYHSNNCNYRTQIWNNPLQNCFTKECKRFYPMDVMCRAFKTKYIHSKRLDYIFVTKVDIDLKDTYIEKLDIKDNKELICDVLRRQCFDFGEKSFHPWLMDDLNVKRYRIEELYTSLNDNHVDVYVMKINPYKLQDLDKLIVSL